jgi:zinc/manganese transport system ATP-binding protein
MGEGATSGAVLSVEGLGVRIAGRQILDGVDFAIAPAEFTGLIGSNGAGKTTLFRAILGLQAATAGQILVDGRPRTRRTDSIGYVPQKFLLDPDLPLRGRDLVGLGLDARRLGFTVNRRRRAERVEEMLAAVGAESFADTRVGRLSGGEQQRILIAHALVSGPRLLLADEPLANLDLRSSQEVVALLARVCRERGVAVLISAHEINALLPVMDRVVYLANGRAASGTSQEVIRPDVLSRLYGHHVDVIDVHGRVLIVAGAGDDRDLHGCEETVEHELPDGASELDRHIRQERSEAGWPVP